MARQRWAYPAGATLGTKSFNRVLLSGRSLVFSYPTVHTQQSSVPNGVAEHNVTVARAFTKLMGAFGTTTQAPRSTCWPTRHWRGQAGGQPPGVSDAAGQPAVPSQPHEGSLGPRGHLRRHGAQHRHRPRGLPAPQLHCRLSHRARAQDAAEWCQPARATPHCAGPPQARGPFGAQTPRGSKSIRKGFWKTIMLSMTPCSTSSVHSSRSVLLAKHTPTLLAPSSWKLPGSQVPLNTKNCAEGHPPAFFLFFWAHSKAVSRCIKNEAEGHRAFFFSFFLNFKSGVTLHQNEAE